jgi:hypothetical protein
VFLVASNLPIAALDLNQDDFFFFLTLINSVSPRWVNNLLFYLEIDFTKKKMFTDIGNNYRTDTTRVYQA